MKYIGEIRARNGRLIFYGEPQETRERAAQVAFRDGPKNARECSTSLAFLNPISGNWGSNGMDTRWHKRGEPAARCDIGLFSDAAMQTDLLDMARSR